MATPLMKGGASTRRTLKTTWRVDINSMCANNYLTNSAYHITGYFGKENLSAKTNFET